jgi:hypothetical protein
MADMDWGVELDGVATEELIALNEFAGLTSNRGQQEGKPKVFKTATW